MRSKNWFSPKLNATYQTSNSKAPWDVSHCGALTNHGGERLSHYGLELAVDPPSCRHVLKLRLIGRRSRNVSWEKTYL